MYVLSVLVALCSFPEIMVKRAAGAVKNIKDKLRALPRHFHVGDMFTGVGTWDKVVHHLVEALQKEFPAEMTDLEATWTWTKNTAMYCSIVQIYFTDFTVCSTCVSCDLSPSRTVN